MGKKGAKSSEGSGGGTFGSSTIRHDSNARKQSHVNPKLMLKLDHIKNLAVWASGVASIPSLSSFFGTRLAACSESLGLPPYPSLVSCQRCESVLQPGYNCTIRVEKSNAKAPHKNKKSRSNPQNYAVYTCHSCSHRNLKTRTARGYLKEICPRKDKPLTHKSSESKTINKHQPQQQQPTKVPQVGSEECGWGMETLPLPEEAEKSSPNQSNNIDNETARGLPVEPTDAPSTPSSVSVDISLLDSKRKRRRNKSGGLGKSIGSARPTATNNTITTTTDAIDQSNKGTGRKRRRKSWTSLKEIAESSGRDHSKFANVAISFLL